MAKLRGPSGMGSGVVSDLERRVRRAVRTSIWGTSVGGRGRTLKGLLWVGGGARGPKPELPDAEEAVRWTRRWVDHLIVERVRTESELEEHIGGWAPERDVLYPPDIKPLRLAFAAIADRLGELGDAEKRLRDATRTPRLSETSRQGPSGRERWLRRAKAAVDAARKELRPNRAVFDAIGAARHCSSDAIRKALEKSEKSRREGGKQWQRYVDYRQIITATPQRPGTRRVYFDAEELKRRHPGAWERLPRRD